MAPLEHTLTNDDPNSLGVILQNELTRQLKLDRDKQNRSFSWKLLRTLKSIFHATQYQGDTALTIPRYLVWVLDYIPYMGLAVFSSAISRVPVYTAISNF